MFFSVWGTGGAILLFYNSTPGWELTHSCVMLFFFRVWAWCCTFSCRELYLSTATIYGRYEIRSSAGGSGCLTGCLQVRLSVCACVCLCACVRVCVLVSGTLPFDSHNLRTLRDTVLSGRFRVPYWMSTGLSVCLSVCLSLCACMCAEWEAQGAVLDVYRCVSVCRYACWVLGSGFRTRCLSVCMRACVCRYAWKIIFLLPTNVVSEGYVFRVM